jgi:MerR family transcriptional regulator, copper efflux regulator
VSRDVKAGDGESNAGLHQIGQVAERVGLSLRTVRYYEEQGLLIPQTRTGGGFRLYSDGQIERLELIKQMKPLGFRVDEMRALLDARDAMSDPSAAHSERDAATKRLREFAEAASRRCEELSAQVKRASDLAQRLRREAHGPDGGPDGRSEHKP